MSDTPTATPTTSGFDPSDPLATGGRHGQVKIDQAAVEAAIGQDEPTEADREAEEAARQKILNVTPEVLRAQGVPVELARVDEAGNVVEVDGIPVTETKNLRFNANSVAEIEVLWDGCEFKVEEMITEGPNAGAMIKVEKTFYGAEAFQVQMEAYPTRTIRQVFALAFGLEPEDAGRRMLSDKATEYAAGVMAAWAMAQGADPQVAAQIYNRAAEMKAIEMAKAVEEIDKMFAADADGTGPDEEATTGSPEAP